MEVKNVKIEYLGHSGFLIVLKDGARIMIDPYNLSDKVGKADLVLITHSHYDHCSIKDIEKVSKKGTIIAMPADAQSKIMKIKDIEIHVVEIGDEFSFGNMKIEGVPSYNVDKEFHPKSEGWLGYLLKFSDLIIYHAGDTDKIDEMGRLSGYGKRGNEFVALLPVSGTYVMNPEEASEVAKFLGATIAIPMHYGAGVAGTIDDAKFFVELCREKGIPCQILEKI